MTLTQRKAFRLALIISGAALLVVAGFGVGSRIESVVGMVVIGISTSVVPLVGQNWGAREFDQIG